MAGQSEPRPAPSDGPPASSPPRRSASDFGLGGLKGIAPGGAEGSRTPDLLIANEALYQLSYGPTSRVAKGAAHKERGRALSRMAGAGRRAADAPTAAALPLGAAHDSKRPMVALIEFVFLAIHYLIQAVIWMVIANAI